MSRPERYFPKELIVSSNKASAETILKNLRKGCWVDANAAIRAIGERDEHWRNNHEFSVQNRIPKKYNQYQR